MPEVLLIGPLLPSGGVARYVQDLLSWSGKYQFVLFNVARPVKKSAKPTTGYDEILNAGWVRALQGLLITLGHMIVFPWALMRSRASIVHVCGISYWRFWENAYYILVSRLLGRRVTLHYLGALDLYYTRCGKIERALARMVLRWPQKVILLSEKVHALVAGFLPTERLSVIPSNVDTSQFSGHGEKQSAVDGITRVLFVGGSDPFRKGIYDLLDAAASVITAHPDVRFVMSGGDSFQAVATRWHELGLERYVEFIGWIPEDEKARVYQSADMLVLPSHNEGLPYVVIEALASGLPIIASAVGGIPEAVIHGENGYIFEPGDSRALEQYILSLARDPGLRQAMGRRNRRRAADRYSSQVAFGRLERLFDQIMQK